MASAYYLLPFIISTFHAVDVTGQCGHPGQPLNGTAYFPLNPQGMNQINLQTSFYEAVYFCSDDHLITKSTNDWRKCVDGVWNGEIPQCAEVKKIWQFLCAGRGRCDGNLRTGCKSVDINTPFVFSIGVARRLYGIQLMVTKVFRFPMESIKWTVEGQRNDQSEWELLKQRSSQSYRTDEHRNISIYFDSSVKHKKVRVSIGSFGVDICGIEVFAYYDECGHPEVPLNGRVQWNTGDTEAIYRCDDGYRLNVPSATRQCVEGKWNGLQAICVYKGLERTTRRPVPVYHPPTTTTRRTEVNVITSSTSGCMTQPSEELSGRMETVGTSPGVTGTTTAPPTMNEVTMGLTITCCVLILIIVAMIIGACRKMRRNTKEQKSFEVAMARIKPPTGHDDASTLQIRYSSPPEHQYEEIRYSQVTSARRPIPEGLEGYEIANHFL